MTRCEEIKNEIKMFEYGLSHYVTPCRSMSLIIDKINLLKDELNHIEESESAKEWQSLNSGYGR